MENHLAQQTKQRSNVLKHRVLPKTVITSALRSDVPSLLTYDEVNFYLRSHHELGCLPMSWTSRQGCRISVATTTNYSHTVFMKSQDFDKYAKRYNFRSLNKESVEEPNVIFDYL